MFRQEVNEDRHHLKLLNISPIFIPLEPLACEVVGYCAILPASLCTERHAKVHVHRDRTWQQTSALLRQILDRETTDQDEVIVESLQRRPRRQQRGLRTCKTARRVLGETGELAHGL